MGWATVRRRTSNKPCSTSHYTKSSPGDHKSFPGPLMATGSQSPGWKQHERLRNVPSPPSQHPAAVFSPRCLSVGETFSCRAARTGSRHSPLLVAVFNDSPPPSKALQGFHHQLQRWANSETNYFIKTTAFCRIQKHTLWFLPWFGRFVVGEIKTLVGFFLRLKLNTHFFFYYINCSNKMGNYGSLD